ncbi:MAG: HD-GYP domain-containing protein [Bacillota bacterium]
MAEQISWLMKKLKEISENDTDTGNPALTQFLSEMEDIIGIHSIRVAGYAVITAHKMGIPEDLTEVLQTSALLHDIGKTLIPDNIIYKTGGLTGEEVSIIQQHPVFGRNILLQIEKYSKYSDIVLHHHEYFNGLGYPSGLSSSEIPILSRIIAVADAYEAMTSDRPYRKGFSHREAVTRLKLSKNKQFDPEVIDSFLIAIKSFSDDKRIKGKQFLSCNI